MRIQILETVYGPSVLGSEPVFAGDVLDVDAEAGAQLIESGHALEPAAEPEVEPVVSESDSVPSKAVKAQKSAESDSALSDSKKAE